MQFEVDADTLGRKSAELRDRQAPFQLQLDPATRGRDERADLAQIGNRGDSTRLIHTPRIRGTHTPAN